jgi:hypothetical protein
MRPLGETSWQKFLEAFISQPQRPKHGRRHFLLSPSLAADRTVTRSRASSRSAWIVAKIIAKNIAIENRASPMSVSFQLLNGTPYEKFRSLVVSRYNFRCETILNVAFI